MNGLTGFFPLGLVTNGLMGAFPPGLVTGAVYALLAMGLVLIYKATRVPNFAYGAMATFVGFFHYSLVTGKRYAINVHLLYVRLHLHAQPRLPFWGAMPVSLIVAGLLGLVIERLVIRPFAKAPAVTLIIVTLALATVLSAITQQLFGANDLIVASRNAIFPRTVALSVVGVKVSYEQAGVIVLVVALAAALFAFFRFTSTGLAIRAVATDRDVASLLGVSSRQLSIVSWLGGSMVAGLAGIALASLLVTSNPNLLLTLTIKGFAAAIIGGMTSFPIAVAAGFAIGVVEELTRHLFPRFAGAPEVVTLGAVIIVLSLRPSWIFRGIRDDQDSGVTAGGGAPTSALAKRIDPAEAFRVLRAAVPLDGPVMCALGRWRWVIPAALVALAVGFPLLPLPSFWALAANLTVIDLLVVLSFVVLIGWLGQISVAQGAFIAVGGAGTVVCAHVVHLPFPLPVFGAVLFSIPVSVLVGLPALRLRGLHLVIATLAFGLAAQTALLPRFSASTRVVIPSLLNSDGAKYEFSLLFAALAFALAWRVSTTRIGRSFRALRDSEIVASAYGIRPVRTKLTGFVLSGGIAALAGALLTYQLGSVSTVYGSVFFSITWLSQSVVAGITSIAGPVIGALLFGLYPQLTQGSVSASHLSFLPEAVAGALTIVIMAINPEGLASMSRFVRSRVSAFSTEDDELLAIEAATEAATAPLPEDERELVNT